MILPVAVLFCCYEFEMTTTHSTRTLKQKQLNGSWPSIVLLVIVKTEMSTYLLCIDADKHLHEDLNYLKTTIPLQFESH